MLTRNSQIEKLLEEGDFNARVTIFNPTTVSTNPTFQKGAWKEVIRDSLGGGIISDPKLYSLSLRTADKVLLNDLHVTGNSIADTIVRFCQTPQPIRITLRTLYSKRVWIIA